ncbi:MAG TPA: magnesium/cobalt transporter CorA [Vicinamibacterales bacterium]
MLVNCAAYKQGRKLADIELRDAKRYMNEPGCFVWVALRDPEPAEMKELQEEFALHDLAVEDASGGHQRPKMEEYGRSLFIVVHSVEPGDGGLHIGQVSIFVGDSYILSVRHATRYGFSELRGRTEREPELLSHGPAYVLYALLDSVVDRYFPVLEALSDETEELEEKIFGAQTTRAQVEALYALKRKLTGLKHAVSPLLEVTTKLHGGRVPAMCAGLQDYFRDVHDHLVRLEQSIDTLRDAVSTAVSMNLSLITLQENEVTKRLASYAALIAVPTLIVGVYGMNFTYMPELQWRFGYPLVLSGMVLIDVWLFSRFRRAKWL